MHLPEEFANASLLVETKYHFIYSFNQKVIKILRSDLASPQEINRLQYEFNILSRFDSPYIVKPYDFKKYLNTAYLIMENFHSSSLDKFNFKDTPIIEIIDIFRKCTQAVHTIHESNIIHRDINPSNFLYNNEEKKLKIIDFGIATDFSTQKLNIKNINYFVGTLAYSSPEQTGRIDRNIDHRSDLYSLGITFYQLITGSLPFKEKSKLELIHAHLTKIPQAPDQLRTDIPAIICQIILKLLEKNPENRYQSAYGLLQDLNKIYGSLKNKSDTLNFSLAEQDVPHIFIIHDKLYGRKFEYQTILDCLAKSKNGKTQVCALKGSSGIGKTMLAREISNHPDLCRFTIGKHEQFEANVPYSGLKKALTTYISNLRACPKLNLTKSIDVEF